MQSQIKSLVASDPLLNDLPIETLTSEDLENLIALHHGQGMHLKVLRGDDTHLQLVVRRDATLRQLRRQIRQATVKELNDEKDRKERRTFSCSPSRISWKHVWKTYGLKFDGAVLEDMDLKLTDVGIKNGSTLTFVKLKKRDKKR